MTLLRPEFWLLLIPTGILAYLLWSKPRQTNEWQNIIDKPLLAFLMPNNLSQRQRTLSIAVATFWLMCIAALLGPSFKQTLVYQNKQLTPRIILLDLSQNMLVDDITPNRIDRAKFKIKDLLEKTLENETAFAVFTEEPFLVTPFTEDDKTIDNLLQRLSPELMPIDGQNISKALEFAETLFKKNAMHTGEILLVTASVPSQNDFDTAARLASHGFHTSVFAIGQTNNLPITTYQSLASQGHGQLQVFSIDNDDIAALAKPHQTGNLLEKDTMQYQKEDDGYYLVFILLLIVLLAYRAGWYEQITGT